MKLMIAIPTMETVPVVFMQSLIALCQHLEKENVPYKVVIEAGTLIYLARDVLACKAVNGKYTHVLWLDSDMVFSDHIFEDLLETGKSFVSGIAHGRRSPFLSCLFKDIDLSKLTRWTLDEYPNDTFEVEGCGMACALTSVDILNNCLEQYKTCFTPITNYGEDLSFCKRVKSQGVRIWAEPTVRLGHVAHLTVYPEDAERFASEIH